MYIERTRRVFVVVQEEEETRQKENDKAAYHGVLDMVVMSLHSWRCCTAVVASNPCRVLCCVVEVVGCPWSSSMLLAAWLLIR